MWLIFLLVVGFAGYRYLKADKNRNPHKLPLPPGPKGLPLLGNLLQVPQENPWLVYREWRKQYGDVIYLEALGQSIIMLNTLKAAVDLLEKKSANFSDRPAVPAFDILRLDWSFPLMNQGPFWRAHRRLFHEHFSQTKIPNYRPVMEEEIALLIRNLHSNPKNFLEDTRQAFGMIIMRVAYGVSDPEYNYRLVEHAAAITRGFSDVTIPGRYLVNVLPFLRHVPAFLPFTSIPTPGTGWKRQFDELAERGRDLVERPWADARERVRTGGKWSEYPSVAGTLINALPDVGSKEFAYQNLVAKNTVSSVYIAGADTATSSAHGLYMALALNPEVQRKAQQQIDSVVGKLKLPSAADIAQLPYVQAIVKELGRWYSVGPLGLPHSSTEDDEYNGWFIPKKSVIMINVWSIFHDPEVFEDPMEFKPERYLTEAGEIDPSVLDPEAGAFGFGRRQCPGRHFSNESVGLLAASILSMFDVKPAVDEYGREKPLKLEVKAEIVTKPMPFECEIVPRSEKHREALLSL